MIAQLLNYSEQRAVTVSHLEWQAGEGAGIAGSSSQISRASYQSGSGVNPDNVVTILYEPGTALLSKQIVGNSLLSAAFGSKEYKSKCPPVTRKRSTAKKA